MPRVCVGWIALLSAAACGGCNAHVEREVRDLRTQLSQSEKLRGESERRVEELDNRLFLLTDRLESQRVAMNRRGAPLDEEAPKSARVETTAAQPPALPVVKLMPKTSAPNREQPETRDDDAVASNTDEQEFAEHQFITEPTPAHPRPSFDNHSAPRAQSKPRLTAMNSGTLLPSVSASGLQGSFQGNRAPSESSLSLGVHHVPSLEQVRGEQVRGEGREDAHGGSDVIRRYRDAYDKLMRGASAEAEAEFRDFVRLYPHHDYADNAQYWLGESLYARKEYRAAATEFQSVVQRWPSGNKAPDALLKLAYCFLSLGDARRGHDMLARVVAHYPNTAAARLAARKIGEREE